MVNYEFTSMLLFSKTMKVNYPRINLGPKVESKHNHWAKCGGTTMQFQHFIDGGGRSGVQGHPRLYSEFKASPVTLNLSQKKSKTSKQKQLWLLFQHCIFKDVPTYIFIDGALVCRKKKEFFKIVTILMNAKETLSPDALNSTQQLFKVQCGVLPTLPHDRISLQSTSSKVSSSYIYLK